MSGSTVLKSVDILGTMSEKEITRPRRQRRRISGEPSQAGAARHWLPREADPDPHRLSAASTAPAPCHYRANPVFAGRELPFRAMEIMRQESKPLPASVITVRASARNGIDGPGPGLRKMVVARPHQPCAARHAITQSSPIRPADRSFRHCSLAHARLYRQQLAADLVRWWRCAAVSVRASGGLTQQTAKASINACSSPWATSGTAITSGVSRANIRIAPCSRWNFSNALGGGMTMRSSCGGDRWYRPTVMLALCISSNGRDMCPSKAAPPTAGSRIDYGAARTRASDVIFFRHGTGSVLVWCEEK